MKTTRGLAGVLCIWLLFNMVAIPLWWGGVDAQAGLRWWVQGVVLAGFVGMLLFDLATGVLFFFRSCFLDGGQEGDLGRRPCPEGWLLVLALLAVMGLAGGKVMVDEISRETAMGWVPGAEWAVLYVCLTLQLAYLLALLFLPARAEAPT